MWQKKIKKTLFTLCVNNYAPEITELTFPYLKYYAEKIGADFFVISERKFPDYPPVYEKLQIYDYGREMENDWNIFIDADALVHPETVDFTELIKKDTVMHHGADMASIRWKYDNYFRRDGRNIGSCNWFTIASDWCIDLWKPISDLSYQEIVSNISPTVEESNTVVKASHLIDDYTLSRNIAKYGFKFTTVLELLKQHGMTQANFFFHLYTIPINQKIVEIKNTIALWKLEQFIGKNG
jgi:hypothetical protein